MNDRPTADELLEAVREYLHDEVAPEAPTHRARFRALIAANVVAIVRRELARRDDPARLEQAQEMADRRPPADHAEIRPQDDLGAILADITHRPGAAVIGEREGIHPS